MLAGGVQARDTQGILWWSRTSKLYRYDLGTAATSVISEHRVGSPVMCLASDRNGRIWTGHKQGLVRVWTNNGEMMLSSIEVCPSGVR